MNLMDIDTVALDDENDAVVIIDQTLLPNEIKLLKLESAKQIWDAIYLLQVRGAPAIGVCAAFGMYILAKKNRGLDRAEFVKKFYEDKDYLDSSRPTAVNLSWALNEMAGVIEANPVDSVDNLVDKLKDKATFIRDEDIATCKKIGEYGLSLIKPGDGVLTHCNAGKLATVRYGTATAPIYAAFENGYDIKVYCDETRPLLQGARLTSFELSESGIDTTLICDNMSALLMKKGKVDAIFVGCDRVAANGDAANKIGTSLLSIAAKHYGVPVYICAPTSTIDMNTKTGDDIVIEERKGEEIKTMWYEKPMATEKVKTFNPAFDVTDNSLIAGIITEYGIARAPYTDSLKEIMDRRAKSREN